MFHIRLFIAAADVNLLFVELDVALLQLAHLFNLVQVNDKTLLHVVKFANALATKNGWVFRAVEMLDALVMFLA